MKKEPRSREQQVLPTIQVMGFSKDSNLAEVTASRQGLRMPSRTIESQLPLLWGIFLPYRLRIWTSKRRSGAPRKFDGKQEAYLVALACSPPPAGWVRWTLQLLADKLLEWKVVHAISDETVRLRLKKTT